jgi:hypothetical protein
MIAEVGEDDEEDELIGGLAKELRVAALGSGSGEYSRSQSCERLLIGYACHRLHRFPPASRYRLFGRWLFAQAHGSGYAPFAVLSICFTAAS